MEVILLCVIVAVLVVGAVLYVRRTRRDPS